MANEFDHVLAQQELAAMKARATRGDSTASLEVAAHYLAENNLRDGDFWMRQSSEQGNCEAHWHYAELLLRAVGDRVKAAHILDKLLDSKCRKFVGDYKESVARLKRSIGSADANNSRSSGGYPKAGSDTPDLKIGLGQEEKP
ncbi:MAG TPA: hypothetical protein VFS55_09435 [Dokdonella sp.]|nr:hypothetical protein [Dokdonella sp.]